MTCREVSNDLRKAAEILWKGNVLLDSDEKPEKPFPFVNTPTPLQEYIDLIKNKDYTFLLKDGSVIQMGFKFDAGGFIEKHRLTFFHSPLAHMIKNLGGLLNKDDVVVALELLLGDSPSDEDTSPEQCPGKGFPLVYSFRLDYDENGQHLVNHPKSHATFLSENCRIAVNSYFDVRTFLLLVFGNLWAEYGKEVLGELQSLDKLNKRAYAQSTTFLPNDYNLLYGVHFSL